MTEDSANWDEYWSSMLNSEVSRSQALHDYGLIQFEKQNFELAYEYFTEAGLEASKKVCIGMIVRGQAKKKINLVVGSDRNPNLHLFLGKLMNSSHGPDVDTTHTKSFNGEAVTINFYNSWIKGSKHIVGDASVYDFSAKHEIKHALLESLLVEEDDSSHPNFTTCSCIENISKAMKSGAVLEIELNLNVVNMDISDYEKIDFSVNPFQGYLNYEVRLQAFNLLAYEKALKRPKDFKLSDFKEMKRLAEECVPSELCDMYVRIMREAVEFYQQFDGKCGIKDSFFERAKLETNLIIAVLNECKIFTPFDVLKISTQDLFLIYPQFRLVSKDIPDGFNTDSYDKFSDHSHLKVLMNDIAVEHNTPYVEKYLQSVGFKDVTVERRTNEHNGRQNVWMVRAVKV